MQQLNYSILSSNLQALCNCRGLFQEKFQHGGTRLCVAGALPGTRQLQRLLRTLYCRSMQASVIPGEVAPAFRVSPQAAVEDQRHHHHACGGITSSHDGLRTHQQQCQVSMLQQQRDRKVAVISSSMRRLQHLQHGGGRADFDGVAQRRPGAMHLQPSNLQTSNRLFVQ